MKNTQTYYTTKGIIRHLITTKYHPGTSFELFELIEGTHVNIYDAGREINNLEREGVVCIDGYKIRIL